MRSLPRNAQLWLPGYARDRLDRLAVRRDPTATIDILFCVADHFEPDHGHADLPTRWQRLRRWVDDYPKLASRFRDADGRPPQHTFFSPLEVYREDHLEALAELCRAGYGEVEVHLHHGHDTSDNLRDRLTWFRETLAGRHGLLARDEYGHARYGFIHGNWALDNGRLDPQFCGVNDELTVLRETGCYADFTMPAVPDPAQSRVVNALYYAVDDPLKPRSYDAGQRVRVHGQQKEHALLMVQGPLMVRWDSRLYGVLPRVEHAAIDRTVLNHPTLERFRVWLKAGVSVVGRPEWIFVKVHAHGAKEATADVLLGDPMIRFHEAIGSHFNDGTRYRLHYVTARETYNIIKAAERGESGNLGLYRDYPDFRSSRVNSTKSPLNSKMTPVGLHHKTGAIGCFSTEPKRGRAPQPRGGLVMRGGG